MGKYNIVYIMWCFSDEIYNLFVSFPFLALTDSSTEGIYLLRTLFNLNSTWGTVYGVSFHFTSFHFISFAFVVS